MEDLIAAIEVEISVYKSMLLKSKKEINKNKDVSFHAINIVKYDAKLEILEFIKNRLNNI